MGLLLAILTIDAPACTARDDIPPAASLTVTSAKAQIVAGGVLDLTYRFEVLPEASLPLDYTVFVHLTNSDGQIVWTADHQPAVPTSQWKPGQVVEYTRAHFLPRTGLVSGEVTVRVGLYRADERIPLQAGPDEGDRAYAAASVEIVPEANGIFLIYLGGWYPDEFSQDGAHSWTWTQKVGTLSFRNPKKDVTLLLEYDARPDAFPDGPQQVTVWVAGQAVASFPADLRTVDLKRIPIPAAALGTAEMVEARIEVDKTFTPTEVSTRGMDDRSLGIRVYHTVIESR